MKAERMGDDDKLPSYHDTVALMYDERVPRFLVEISATSRVSVKKRSDLTRLLGDESGDCDNLKTKLVSENPQAKVHKIDVLIFSLYE